MPAQEETVHARLPALGRLQTESTEKSCQDKRRSHFCSCKSLKTCAHVEFPEAGLAAWSWVSIEPVLTVNGISIGADSGISALHGVQPPVSSCITA